MKIVGKRIYEQPEADPQMKSTKPTSSPADRFAAIMWDRFANGCPIDSVDLQDAFAKSGLAQFRPMTAEDFEGAKWSVELEVGDHMTFLTLEGQACIDRGSLVEMKESDGVE